MQLEFIGAAHEVTGSCHFVEVGSKRFLVDCGMQQGPDIYESQELPVNPAEIDYVFVTHAHIDHSGLLPLLYKNGFRGDIYATAATCELCDIMLKDSAHIQESEAEWKNRKAARSGDAQILPMYDLNDAQGVLEHFISCEYNERIIVSDEINIRFIDAGHLLGSASIEVWLSEGDENRKIVFSGDIGPGNKPLIRDPQKIKDADYILIESTYGDRKHDKPKDFSEALAHVIEETMAKGGNVVIPAFSVGRTQEILYFIRKIKADRMVKSNPDFEVYMDSPMAVESTMIYNENIADMCDEDTQALLEKGINPIRFPGLRVAVTSDESKRINMDMKPKVIISASGMCEAGRIRHHLKHNLWRKESTIVFVGYQVAGTLGNKLLSGVKEVTLFGETINVNATITQLPGMSGHADINNLMDWLGSFGDSPSKVFVVHGDDAVTDNFATKIHDELGLNAYAPYPGDIYDLKTGQMVAAGARVPKKKSPTKIANTVYQRLVAAGERLMAIIRKSKGFTNKDLGKFADQINSLCEKWDN